MKPIEAPLIVNRGISVYFPSLDSKEFSLIKLDIYFSKSNPIFSWLTCDTSKSLIWSKSATQNPKGTFFLYETLDNLPAGFYTVAATLNRASSHRLRGQITIGVISPTPYLNIGVPYSIYPAIDLA